ncbi:MAG: amidase family protein, partial [Burkholderiaceae bacterium]
VERSAWYRHVLGLFERHDYLVLPTAQFFPFDAELPWPKELAGRKMDSYHRWMEVVAGVTVAGLPAISVPAGFDERGLPMGIQLIGPPQGDLSVLKLARAYELATDWVRRRPPPASLTGDAS